VRDHATADCATGVCTFGACDSGWGTCDGDFGNGCETDFGAPASCGTTSCFTILDCTTLANVVTATCSGGACVIEACAEGYAECDDAAFNGCERALAALLPDCATPATWLGDVSGDTDVRPPITSTTTLYGTRRFQFQVFEDNAAGDVRHSAEVTLIGADATVNYDLALFCPDCGTLALTSAGPAGETAVLSWTDSAADDGKTVTVVVAHAGGSTLHCGTYQLVITGNQPDGTRECD
jgi:hypothetical protein